jgi:hypothetical protein
LSFIREIGKDILVVEKDKMGKQLGEEMARQEAEESHASKSTET